MDVSKNKTREPIKVFLDEHAEDKVKKIIIVGAGTAGAIIARRLSPRANVIVVEQSSKKRLPFAYRIPLLIGLLYGKRNNFISKDSLPFDSTRDVPFYKSNVLGGSSVINGAVHVAGCVDSWSRILAKFGFSFGDLTKSYASLYTSKNERKKINIRLAATSSLDECFFDSLSKFGVQRGSVEWIKEVACGLVQNTTSRYFRSSVMSLNPFSECQLKLGCRVERLVINNENEVVGVKINGKVIFSDFVILASGVIGTNSLLQVPAYNIESDSLVRITPDHAGEKIRDHTNLRVNVICNQKINSLNEINSDFYLKFKIFLQFMMGKANIMSGTGARSAAHLDISGNGCVDTRIQLLHFAEDGRLGSTGKLFSSQQPGFSISITQLNPKSSTDFGHYGHHPFKSPYLTDPADLLHLRKALKFTMDLLNTSPLNEYVDRIEDFEQINDDPTQYIMKKCFSGYHLIGGCNEVVNSDFTVKGVSNLSICDASILNEYPSSNIHAPVVLLAEMYAKRFQKMYCR